MFDRVQQAQMRAYRDTAAAAGRSTEQARASRDLVVIPTDSATTAQREKYQRYVEERTARTVAPQGPKRMLFSPDLIGTGDQIAEQLYAHAGFREVDEVAFALPSGFEQEDHVQILTDIATVLGPALGWSPADSM